ncbi:MAG: hypothetical protein WDO73_10125 [Ignavibacteriota bacterium]
MLLYVAVIVELELPLNTPVVTLNVAEVAPAATAADAGTVNAELVSDSDILAPPAGALPLSRTVQVELAELPSVDGVQDNELTVGQAPPVTTPPVEEIPTKYPCGSEPRALPTAIDVVERPTAIVRFKTATVPFAMMPESEPEMTQV